jgi:hypothetical protein
VKAEFFDGRLQVRDRKGDHEETRLGVRWEGGAAADNSQGTAIQIKCGRSPAWCGLIFSPTASR